MVQSGRDVPNLSRKTFKHPVRAVGHSHGPLKSSTGAAGATAGAQTDFQSLALVNDSSELLDSDLPGESPLGG